MSGLVSMGANVVPRIWRTITRSSLGIWDDEEPGRVFELGALLKDLVGIYRENPARIMKKALFDLEVIDSPACTPRTEPLQDHAAPLAEVLLHHQLD